MHIYRVTWIVETKQGAIAVSGSIKAESPNHAWNIVPDVKNVASINYIGKAK